MLESVLTNQAGRLFAAEDERADKILAAELGLLYRGVFAVPVNIFVTFIVAFLLRRSFPFAVLVVWVAATTVVALMRMALHGRFLKALKRGQVAKRWVGYFCAGSFASGALWGAISVGLPSYGTQNDFVLMTLVGAGMTAGALTTLSSYLPAFITYSFTFAAPLIVVSVTSANTDIATNGWLMLLFIVVLCAAAKNLNDTVSRTIGLQVDNEALNASLKEVRGERDEARTDKWSTFAQLSHELRTPLNAILGFSEAMRSQIFGPLGNARYGEYVEHVYSSGRHLLDLITELLQWTEGESGSQLLSESEISASAVISDCIDVFTPAAEKAGVALTAALTNDLPLLRADETKLRQIMFNLVSNAVKFTRANGQVWIGAELGVDGGISFVVRDTGVGIAAADIALVLRPFGRTASPLKYKAEGMGLGLPICKRLAELHGAALTIESRPNEGTTCTVAFPPARTVGRTVSKPTGILAFSA